VTLQPRFPACAQGPIPGTGRGRSIANDQVPCGAGGDNRAVRKLLACLLLAVLPLTPSWAGVAVDCPGRAKVAAFAQEPPAAEGIAIVDCCEGDETQDVQCGSDCTDCHGLGLTALTGMPAGIGVPESAPGDSTHACRIAASVASEPLRPPSRARA